MGSRERLSGYIRKCECRPVFCTHSRIVSGERRVHGGFGGGLRVHLAYREEEPRQSVMVTAL